jgi:hypothetical protein
MKCECKTPAPASHKFAEGQNHRADVGDLVCGACGGGIKCTPEEYAAAEKADARWLNAGPKNADAEPEAMAMDLAATFGAYWPDLREADRDRWRAVAERAVERWQPRIAEGYW